jgi:hypothetical protein
LPRAFVAILLIEVFVSSCASSPRNPHPDPITERVAQGCGFDPHDLLYTGYDSGFGGESFSWTGAKGHSALVVNNIAGWHLVCDHHGGGAFQPIDPSHLPAPAVD